MTLFFRQYRAELVKLFARKRTWMGFIAFLGLELIILLILQTDRVQAFSGRSRDSPFKQVIVHENLVPVRQGENDRPRHRCR